MQPSDRDRPAHRFKGARLIRPLQVAPAFAAALFGAFGQQHGFRKRLRHERAGCFIPAANGSRFNGIERKQSRGSGLVGKHLFEPGFV